MSKPWDTLPDGLTLEMLDAYARERENARRRADYAKHPERVARNRMSTYCNFLTRHGKLVIDRPPAAPWNAAQRSAILAALEAAMGGSEQ